MTLLLSLLRRIVGEGISVAALGRFCDQCAVLIGAGLSVERAVERAAPTGDAEIVAMAKAMRPALAAGLPLSRAFAPFAGRLPPIFLPLVEVGEVSGTLEKSFQRLANAFHRDAGFEQRYQYQIFNPWLILAVIFFQSIFGGIGIGIASGGRSGLLAGLAIVVFLFIRVVCLFIVARWILRYAIRWEPFRYAVDLVKMAIPVMGVVARDLAGARWARSFATLYNAGVPVSQSLEISAKSALNAAYERALRHAAAMAREGKPLSESLAGTQMLPTHLIAVIAAGEETGNVGDAVDRFASLLESEAVSVASRSFMGITVAAQIVVTFIMLGAASI